MQLVLLSGGSGKRLWPLSNNARSKQFLPLLEKEDGTMESMVQRVVRQARLANLTEDITLATNASQQDIIVNQLGDSVNLVTEPERRDTFPAIALAASYLKLAKQCADDEVVVIMPCDPYTEVGYFETIGKMVECVKADVADLVLMGIAPTYASEKYGYVIPMHENTSTGSAQADNENYKMVSRFTEKPSVEVAETFLKQGAYWNGGVFAFRLGYMMNIVRKYMSSDRFEDTRARYSEFPKISFDYEVAEKAESVAVVPFNGEWKDLGTWNTLTDELHKPVIGNAVMGAHCENTHVINELQNPIFVDGLKDVVVAACPDGILVCSKEHSEEIKKSVENLTPRPMYEERRWGTYRVLDDSYYADGRHSLTKSITLKEGKNISYQIHHHRSETWTFVQGEGIFVLDGREQKVKAGDTVVIPVEHWHAIKALTELTFIEVQSGNPLIEEDIERTEWTWSE
ncbi:mannose-1-phosphate guanylyltransferase [Prevotella sp. P4-51]|uniref:sugar phosphate nucleotidyltransferase n=1 Tax=Prevotella sp. P4-51 TaxID=2024228 RepID=UPI000B96B825|nr:sugar phosphate nucleotidyltransferase [Prevotella sp. P4-51]OYP73940.1 mannose-1-phosphate guanylyltransferase [Prevotella sp. P4-51]